MSPVYFGMIFVRSQHKKYSKLTALFTQINAVTVTKLTSTEWLWMSQMIYSHVPTSKGIHIHCYVFQTRGKKKAITWAEPVMLEGPKICWLLPPAVMQRTVFFNNFLKVSHDLHMIITFTLWYQTDTLPRAGILHAVKAKIRFFNNKHTYSNLF